MIRIGRQPLLGLILLLGSSSLCTAQATAHGPGQDFRRLWMELRITALELRSRDGLTFYAVAAFVRPDGTIEQFTPDHWPESQSPPEAWRDALIGAVNRFDHPVRAVALLIDWGALSRQPNDTTALFHAESVDRCEQLREVLRGTTEGSDGVSWGEPTVERCERWLMSARPAR